MLSRSGHSVWDYRDWKWEPGEVVFHPPVSDIGAFAAGEPEAFRHEEPGDIDRATLRRILKVSRVVALVVPEQGKMTAGMLEEIRLAKQVHSLTSDVLKRPVYLCCTLQKNGALSDRARSLAFADHISFDCSPGMHSNLQPSLGHSLACRIARLLLLQIIADIRVSNELELQILVGSAERLLRPAIKGAKALERVLIGASPEDSSGLASQIYASESLLMLFECLCRDWRIDLSE